MYGCQLRQRTLRLVKLFSFLFLSIARGTYMALNKPNPWNSPQFMQKCNDILVFCVHFNTDIYSNTKEKEILKHRFTLELFSVGW